MALMFFDTPRYRSRNVKYGRINPRLTLSQNQSLIRQRYRFTDRHLDWLTSLLSPMLTDERSESWTIPKRLQVVVGDTLGCSQKTVSNIVRRVVVALNHPDIVKRFIVFKPTDREWCAKRADEFARAGKFSNVIGCIDGTLVKIKTPSENGPEYMSRKGFSCLNVCVICDAVGRILYVNSGFPGSAHDASVWNHCAGSSAFASGEAIQGYALLGDCGYSNGSGIITPYRPTSIRGDSRKERYNREHARIRARVERLFGRWKTRFAILSDKIRLSANRAKKVVIACAVLHNIGYCINATTFRPLGRRRSTIPHPPRDVDIRTYMVSQI
ncbi:hypothetical protein Y032_0715g1772 [Ancylostoma ceylanicum]|uniref:DDE Tnp4 domain-containing protein n=1 Tax=Ancylostoma ceylanicum TaxID=53326 RepID=A0A016WHG0_9BILA|nr:hypothetical protein Y032_0715g1772 [Ancylostoma ceylanicum]